MSDGVFWPEFEQWMLAHGLDPADTAELVWRPPHAGGFAQADNRPQHIEALVYLRNKDGKHYSDGRGGIASEWRLVPMRHLPAVEVTRYSLGAWITQPTEQAEQKNGTP